MEEVVAGVVGGWGGDAVDIVVECRVDRMEVVRADGGRTG